MPPPCRFRVECGKVAKVRGLHVAAVEQPDKSREEQPDTPSATVSDEHACS